MVVGNIVLESAKYFVVFIQAEKKAQALVR